MSIELQFKIKENKDYLRYLRENSYWYKYLNRNPNNLNSFIKKVKEDYNLKGIDKIERALSAIEMAEKIISTLK